MTDPGHICNVSNEDLSVVVMEILPTNKKPNLTFFNPYHVEVFKWNNPSSIFGTAQYHFRDIKLKI